MNCHPWLPAFGRPGIFFSLPTLRPCSCCCVFSRRSARGFGVHPACRIRGRASVFGRCRRYFPGLAISLRLWQTCRRVWLGISRLRGSEARFRARPESDCAKAVIGSAKPGSVLPKPEIRAGIFPFLMHGVGIARGLVNVPFAGEGRRADCRFWLAGGRPSGREGRSGGFANRVPLPSGSRRHPPFPRNSLVQAAEPPGLDPSLQNRCSPPTSRRRESANTPSTVTSGRLFQVVFRRASALRGERSNAAPVGQTGARAFLAGRPVPRSGPRVSQACYNRSAALPAGAGRGVTRAVPHEPKAP